MIPDFKAAKVLVVGDVMLDSYWQGTTQRISPEAPVPVVHVNDLSYRLGGSGNVAMNLTALGAAGSLLALMGEDESGRTLKALLQQSGIIDLTLSDPSFPTTTKLRVLSQHQQLIRLDFEQVVDEFDVTPVLDVYAGTLDEYNLVVLSDYAKGLLNDAQPFIRKAARCNIPVLVDPKKSSFSNYSGAFLLTPNRSEFEAVVGNWSSHHEMITKAQKVMTDCQLGGLLITQGGDGMTLIMKGEEAQQFPAHAKEVYDVTGAGDTVIASLAAGIASGLTVQEAVHLSCQAAGIVVGRVGTASVSVDDLKTLEASSRPSSADMDDKIMDAASVLDVIAGYRSEGKKIVFTNGCFDLLHAGHVRYLEQAATLGDILVVAVNSDESVRQLKGAERPLNELQDRIQVLAGLAAVDLVTDFSELTPEKLICAIKPDILVKGGDYAIDEIAGRECAKEVKLLDFIDGKSSTKIIQKMQNKN